MKQSTRYAVLIAGASLFTVGLGGCGVHDNVSPGGQGAEKPDYLVYRNSSAALWIDPETKCEYISGSISVALIPRLDRTGKQICR